MNPIKNESGITLIEVVISMAVLAIGIFSLYSMQIGAMSGNTRSLLITDSANVARGKIEELISKDYEDADFTEGTHTETFTGSSITSLTWVVTNWRGDGISNDGDSLVDEFDERGVKAVQLTVNYQTKGVSKSTTIHFLKAQIF